jgi:4-hydroxy-tetrahydrodipicolinate synthase
MFKGCIVAVVTPMHPDGSLDKKRFGELLEWEISQGVDGIVVNGTTGESPTLEEDEQNEIIQFTVDCVHGRVPVIAGTGSYSTQHTLKQTQKAFDLGVDACLLIVPYYNRPTQEGLYQHFRKIAENVPGPIILYNQPGRTGTDMLPSTVERLMILPNIVAIKECANTERYKELITRCGSELDILTGNDDDTLEVLRLGGKGVISVAANILPNVVSNLCRAGLAGDWAKAESLAKQLEPLYQNLFVESNPIPVKWLLQYMGKIESGIRLPLTPLSAKYQDNLKTAFEKAQEPI